MDVNRNVSYTGCASRHANWHHVSEAQTPKKIQFGLKGFFLKTERCQPKRTLDVSRVGYLCAGYRFPKALRATARISRDKTGSSTARASVNAPTMPASVVMACLRRLVAVPLRSRQVSRSN
jgi:hypothetical protein